MSRLGAAELEYRERRSNAWRAIPGYGGVYEASFDGRIRRVWKTRGVTPKVMHQKERRGVMSVRLTDAAGRRKEERVHVLVALTWLGEKPAGMCVYHKNGVRTDNSADNLVYLTRSESGRRSGGMASRRAVLKLDVDGEVLAVYPSARAAARVEPFSYQSIMNRCNGKIKKQGGFFYVWDDADEEA